MRPLLLRHIFYILAVAALLGDLRATDVLSYHNDLQSSGVNNTETQLTPANLTVGTFAKRFTTAVDGQVYAQPLYKAGVTVNGGVAPGLHNLVFVATQHDSVYAIDGDSGAEVWHTSLLDSGLAGASIISPMPSSETGSSDVSPEIGVCGTPVLDGVKNLLYVAAKTKQVVGGVSHYLYTIYKLDITNGNATADANILASHIIGDTTTQNGYSYRTDPNPAIAQDPFVFGTGDGAITVNGTSRVYFNALRAMNRPGLTLVNGQVYVAFASHGDNGPYHGWLLRFDASTLTLTAALNTTPNGSEGGIWQAGGITVMDSSGNFYLETGNGTFDGYSNNGQAAGLVASGANRGFPISGDFGDSFMKIALDGSSTQSTQNQNGWGLKVTDYFAPFNNEDLNNADADLGSGGCVLLPDAVGSAAHRHLLAGAGKEGKIYLIDRDNMGGFAAATDTVVQTQGNAMGSSFSTPAVFNNQLFWFSAGDFGKAFGLASGAFSTSAVLTTSDSLAWPGATPSISTNGGTNALAWVIDRSNSVLHAYDVTKLNTAVWSSSFAPGGRDQLGSAVKFSVPTVADGHVFAGTANSLVAYGPPVPPTAPPAAPTSLSAVAASGIEIDLSWPDLANNEDGYRVEQSSDGQSYTEIATVGVNAQSYAVTGLRISTTYYFRVRAFNSYQTLSYSAYSPTASGTTSAQLPTLDFSQGFANSAGVLNFNGSAKLNGTLAELTDGGSSEAGTVWSKDPQNIQSFTTRFRFQITNPTADGFTFAIQQDSPTVVGAVGGSLGYEGVTKSAALKFDIYPDLSTTGLYLNGAAPTDGGQSIDLTQDGFDFHSGHAFDVAISYDGATLIETISDVTTGNVHSYNYSVDLTAAAGGPTAYLGFTGGTGGATATQDILTWAYTAAAATPPSAPTDLAAAPASGTQVNLGWADTSQIESGFIIERQTGGDSNWVQAGVTGANVTQFFDTALAPNTDYSYRVRATNSQGDSDNSNTATVHTPVPPHTPGGAHTTLIGAHEVALAWTDLASNEDGYKILRKTTTASNFAVIATLPPDSQSYDDSKVSPGTTYDYHVQAYNIAGYSDFTGLTITTLPAVTITAPDAQAQEGTLDTGSFIVSRQGDATTPLTVSLATQTGSGQAAAGTRYTLAGISGGTVTIPAGAASVAVSVIPMSDAAVLGNQAVTLQLAPDPAYEIDSPSSATVTLLDPPQLGSLTALAGAYTGVIQGALATEANSGFISLSFAKNGAFTASFRFGDRPYSIHGILNGAALFSTAIKRQGLSDLLVKLSLSTTPQGGEITGQISDAAATANFIANQANWNSKTNPAPFRGRYTMLLRPTVMSATLPGGVGFGTVTIDGNGLLRFSGTLGDGTAVSQGLSVPATSVWPFFATLYGTKGSIGGNLTFRNVLNVSDLDGTLSWFKPPVMGALLYPAGFNTQISATGVLYTPPPRATRVLNFADQSNNALVTISGGNLDPVPPPRILSLTSANLVVHTGLPAFSMSLNVATGLFSGSFVDEHKGFHGFSGALLRQKQEVGVGFFKGNGQTGEILFQAAP